MKGIGSKTMDRIKEELLSDEIPKGEFSGNKLKLNNIYNEDMRNTLNRIPDNSIDLIVTDPPYRTTSRGNAGNSGGMLQKDINKKGQVFENNNIDVKDWIYRLYRVLKNGGHCYIMTNHVNLQKYLNAADNAGFHFIKNLIWNKGNKIMGQYYMSQYEYIIFLRKGEGVKINNCGTPDILQINNKKIKKENGNNYHDTEKPVELMKILIENSSKENEIVLDPFVGIGATVIAAKKTNRRYIGIDINKECCNITKKRVKNLSSS